MSTSPSPTDVTADVGRESEQRLERLGDFEEARCQPAPNEVRAEIEQTLARTFPDPKPRFNTCQDPIAMGNV